MKNASPLKVSVIIPTFNGRRLLEANLPSVFKALQDGDQVIVVDDAGTDDSLSWLRHHYFLEEAPRTDVDFQVWQGQVAKVELKVIVNANNLRFGASCNRGVAAANGDVVWLLNNDVQPEAEVLHFTLPYFEDPLMFAVGCQEIQDHQGHKAAGKAQLWFEKGLFRHQAAKEMVTGPSHWVNGGSSLFSRQKWEQLGGFDQAYYPAYWEDIDLCYRARQQGWKIWFEARAVVRHHHETTNQSVFGQQKIDDMSWHNGQVFTLKNGSWWQKLQYLIWQPYWWLKRARFKQAQIISTDHET